jgi:hypothetical protein
MHQRRDLGRRLALRDEARDLGAGVGEAAQLQQRQRPCQAPVARGVGVAGRGFALVEQRQGLGRPLLLQQAGGEVQPHAGADAFARGCFSEQRFGRFALAGDPHQRPEVGGRDRMAGVAGERLAHRRLGLLDLAGAVAREAEVDPGVGPGRLEPDRGGEGLAGPHRLAGRQPRLAIAVVRRRQLRGRVARLARRPHRRHRLSAPERRHRLLQVPPRVLLAHRPRLRRRLARDQRLFSP